MLFCFFLNDPATTEFNTYRHTLSLHDALPIDDRFNALARLLVPASPRALSQGLTALGRHGLVTRDVMDGRPPASRYGLTERGGLLAEACLRSEEHTSELQSLMRLSYAVFCLKKKNKTRTRTISRRLENN